MKNQNKSVLFKMQLKFILPLALSLVELGNGFKPVIIIPGTGGSRLEARLNKPEVNHWWCHKTSDWYTLWFSLSELLPFTIDCWVDNIFLKWDPVAKVYTDNDGVEVRVPHADGSTGGVEYLDPSLEFGGSDYFHTLIEEFVKNGGVRNVSVRALPYDFRRAPTSAFDGNWLAMMTALVEDTYQLNNHTKVTLLSHSMGCLYTLWFLNQKPQDWKDSYVEQWIPTSGVFSGAALGVVQVLSGDISMVPIPGLSPLTVRGEQRSYESSMWLLPTPQGFGSRNPLVFTPSRNYTASDYQALFQATGNFQEGYERYRLVANLTANLDAPGVLTHHLYGVGVDTPQAFIYSSDNDFDTQPQKTLGNGDGTVNLVSLQSPGVRWDTSNNHDKRFVEKTYPGQDHTGILKDPQYMKDVRQLLS